MKFAASTVAVAALMAGSANAFTAPRMPSQTSSLVSNTELQFGFLKELGFEKPGEEPVSYENGIQVGDAFPKDALKKFGVNGKKAVVYFYGADDAPSCKKQNTAFDKEAGEFKKLGATVVGVRNEKGAKDDLPELIQKLVVDDGDVVRNQIGIKKDLAGLLGGRETYVIGKNGKVEYKFNSQFNPEAHVKNTLEFLSK